jgi:hypothetical protein
MTVGDKWETGIIIASGLSIAYVLEMHKEGVELITNKMAEDLKNFDGQEMSR